MSSPTSPNLPPALSHVIDYARPQMPAIRRMRWPAALVTTLSTVYAPYAWLLLPSYPWNGYHHLWLALWPILPSLAVDFLFRGRNLPVGFVYVVAGGTTLLILTVVFLTCHRSRYRIPPAAVVALVLSSGNSWMAYLLFRA